MKTIPLTQGKVAFVDDEDFERVVAAGPWYAVKKVRKNVTTWYARMSSTKEYLSRFLMGNPGGLQVDHKDGDTMNNTKDNLRVCTNQQNQCNRKTHRSKSSKFKGIRLLPIRPGTMSDSDLVVAQITVNGNNTYLGTFGTEEEAARAYDDAARHYFGQFAKLNFPNEVIS